VLVAAALLAVGLAVFALRERTPAASDTEEIDDASKQALRDILKQDEEQAP
jgi:hypothetical protein